MTPQSKHSRGKKAPARDLQVQRQPRAAELMAYQRRPMNPPSGHVHHHHITVQNPPSVQQRRNPPSKRQMMQIQRIQQTQQGLQKQIAAHQRRYQERYQAFIIQKAIWAQEREIFTKLQAQKSEHMRLQFEQERAHDHQEREQWERDTSAAYQKEREQWERQQDEKEASRKSEWERWDQEYRSPYDKMEEDCRKTDAFLASRAAIGAGVGAGLAFAYTSSVNGDESDDNIDIYSGNGSGEIDPTEYENDGHRSDGEQDSNNGSGFEMQGYPVTRSVNQGQVKIDHGEQGDSGNDADSYWCACFSCGTGDDTDGNCCSCFGGDDDDDGGCWNCCSEEGESTAGCCSSGGREDYEESNWWCC